MSVIINQNDYNIVKQPYITQYIKLYILNFEYNKVDEISGNLISCSVSIDSNSDIRRTCNVSLVVNDTSFDIQSGSKIWMDKYIQPYIGYQNIYTGEIQWYNQGIYLINQPSWAYSATNNTLSFQGVDLMSKLTGLRNGNLPGLPTVIAQGENVREAIIATIGLGGFTKYVVSECLNEIDGKEVIQEVPYDIKIDTGGTLYDILSKLRDILPQYQIYFDVNGVFHYELIPSGEDDPVLVDDDIWDAVLIDESVSTDFESVKNEIVVLGRSHDITNFPSEISINGSNVTMTIASIHELADGTMIGFVLPNDLNSETGIYLNVNGSGIVTLVNSAGTKINSLSKDDYYVAVYKSVDGQNSWLFLGHQQANATWQDKNPDSPFYVNGTVGTIREVLSGGEYDNIQSDELALERAKVEIYWKCRLNDSIQLSCIPIPWLDVNTIITHADRDTTEQDRYMIKTIQMDYSVENVMIISAITLYPFYPVI